MGSKRVPAEVRAAVLTLAEQGKSYGFIGKVVGKTKNAVAAIVFKARNPKYYVPTRSLNSHRHTALVTNCCFVSGCDSEASEGRFCSKHAFRPRTDQPMHRLTARRA